MVKCKGSYKKIQTENRRAIICHSSFNKFGMMMTNWQMKRTEQSLPKHWYWWKVLRNVKVIGYHACQYHGKHHKTQFASLNFVHTRNASCKCLKIYEAKKCTNSPNWFGNSEIKGTWFESVQISDFEIL